MKISVLGEDNFIKKNIIENLRTISDGRNRSRTGLEISSISEKEENDADITLILPTEAKRTLEASGRTYKVPLVAGKWDDSDSIIKRILEAAANDREYPEFKSGEVAEILFIEDMTEEILDLMEGCPKGKDGAFPLTYKVTLDSVIEELESFKKLNSTLYIHEIPKGSFSYKLYSLYLSFLPDDKMTYPVHMNIDNRGIFTELIKTRDNGQVSINIAKPGVTRGQHWHNTKWEIFIVVSGHGLIKERKIGSDEVRSFEVRGEDMRAVIMLPGYTHSITNLEKDRDLVTVMFANEPFDPSKPDTFYEEV